MFSKYAFLISVSLIGWLGMAGSVNQNQEPRTLYLFTGSDWCSNCKIMKSRVLSDSNFYKELNQLNIRVEILDFPRNIKQNDSIINRNKEIAKTVGFQGIFPSMYIYNDKSKENILIEYNGESAIELLEVLKSI